MSRQRAIERPRRARTESEPHTSLEARLASEQARSKALAAELVRAERRVEAMKEIGRVLGSNLDLDPLLEEIVKKARELLDADRATLFVADPEKRQLFSTVMQGGERFEIRLAYGQGVAGWVAEHDCAVAIRDAYDDDRFNPAVDLQTGYRTRGMLSWPIRGGGHAPAQIEPRRDEDDPRARRSSSPRSEAGGKVAPAPSRIRGSRGGLIGVIQVLNKRVGTFDEDDELLLEAIASEIGVALEVARLYRDQTTQNLALERARSELQLLFATERAIAESTHLEPMLQSILDTALSSLSAGSGIVWLFDERSLTLTARVAAGSKKKSLEKLAIPSSDPVHQAATRGQTLVLGPAGAKVADPTNPRIRRGRYSPKQLIAVPIAGTDGTIGAIELFEKRAGAQFSGDDVRALAVVASQAGRAITAERERQERERAERLEAIGRMLSGVVHDMRTPLTLIGGYADMMASSDDAIERRRWSEKVRKQIDVMAGMTIDLLGFARGDRKLLLRKVHVGRFMSDTEEYLTRELDGTGVQLVIEADFRGVAHFDENKIRRVFNNIARNARQAMPHGGRFGVAVWADGGRLWIELEDTGTGIPKEVEDRLFQPFATAGKPGGTGLGLAMVKQTIEEHGGEISYATSKNGTKFTLWIPLEGRDAPKP
ncbi:MAG: GAF domain-containing protein [Deltaproteobacteria bacterium]|nr:GAF domain-containing protein [Deltaproteobacteria bacterium]